MRIKGCKQIAVFARTDGEWLFCGFAVTVKGHVVAVDDRPVESVSWEDYMSQLTEQYGIPHVRTVQFG